MHQKMIAAALMVVVLFMCTLKTEAHNDANPSDSVARGKRRVYYAHQFEPLRDERRKRGRYYGGYYDLVRDERRKRGFYRPSEDYMIRDE